MALGSAEHLAAVRELDAAAQVPFGDEGWRAELAHLRSGLSIAALTMANDAETLVALAARVPRSPGDDRGGTPWTSFVREVAVAKRISDAAAHSEIALAESLLSRHRATLRFLRQGAVPAHRARVLVQECLRYRDEVVHAVEQKLAHRADVLPPWRLRQEITRLAQVVDAEAAAERERTAAAARTATKSELADAQAEIRLTGPAAVVQRWWDELTDRARALKAAGDPRSLGALRFDLAMTTEPMTAAGTDPLLAALTGDEALNGTVFDGRRSRPVQAIVMVPLSTARDDGDDPAWLEGHGWVSADQARALLRVAELRRGFVDTQTGELVGLQARRCRPLSDEQRQRVLAELAAGTPQDGIATRTEPQYEPSSSLAEFVRLRDRYCDGPTGAQVPGRRADLDHKKPWPVGPTTAGNLASRSRRTHVLKHYGWQAADTRDGTTWTSPAGQVVAVPAHRHPPEPGRRRRREPDGDPDPPPF